MPNELLTTQLIANEALLQLKNNLVMAKLVHRDYEDTFEKEGATIRVRRPIRYTVRTNMTSSAQDVKEGNVSVSLDKVAGVDFGFTSTELTLDIERFSERYLTPGVIEIAHRIDRDIAEMYKYVANWSWRGTNPSANTRIDSFDDYAAGPERLDENAVPVSDRSGVLAPADYWGIAGSLTALQADRKAISALEKAKIGTYANTDTYSTAQVWEHTVGASGSPGVTLNTSTQVSTYETVMGTTPIQATYTFGGTAAVTGYFAAGDVITIADVFDINPRTGQRIGGRLKQFVVLATTNTTATTFTMPISPAIIPTGPYKNVELVSAGSKAVTRVGTAATQYRQNMVFHKNAFALVVRPLVLPPGSVDGARATDSQTGLSVRVIPYYTGSTDTSVWRLDVLYGVAPVYPELATRLTAGA